MKKAGIKSLKFLTIVFLTLLFILPLTSAVKPISSVQTNNAGYQIFYPDYYYVPQNQGFTLHLHLSNISDGKPLLNTQAGCRVHLYYPNGSHSFESGLLGLDSNGMDWEIYISPGNFSELGIHSYYIWCNSTAFGGEAKGNYEVTPLGEELTEGKSIIYFLVTLFAFLIFALITWIFLNIEGKNPRNEMGEYLGLNYKKYVKVSLFPLVYVSFLWFFNFVIGLSNTFLGLTLYSNTLEFMFSILIKLTYPVIVVIGIVLIVLMVKDSNITKEYKSLWNRY